MTRSSIVNRQFEKTNFSLIGIEVGDYDQCIFLGCDFSEVDLSLINFYDCSFFGCNLSMAKLAKNTLQDVKFKDCKLLGLHFETCNEIMFSVSFEQCILNLACFYRLKMKKTRFVECSLMEVDFTEADLHGGVFDHCDLLGARFENTNLEKVDFRTAKNYTIDPEGNRIHKARFSKDGVMGLLYRWDIDVE